jgi:hypothetical protein
LDFRRGGLLPDFNNLIKTFFVAGVIGMHYAVPKIKVQAVVAFHQAMVHIVVGRSIMPFK